MYQIMTLNKIAQCGLDKFPAAGYSITDDVNANADAVLVRSYKMHDMELPENLKAIARAGAGVNNIPIEKCSERGIVVFNTPGANANAVKELIIASIISCSRNVVAAANWTRTLEGSADEISKAAEKGKSMFVGHEISGKTLGVIGLGAIGAMVANAAHDLGMNVIGFDPFLSVYGALRLSRAVKVTEDIKKLCEEADYITLHVPYLEESKKTVDQVLQNVKEGVRILNFSRGELVDDAIMESALESGKVACYVTDFASPAVLKMKNTIVTPHLGASTEESEDNCAKMAAKQLIDYLENGNIVNSVNFPECHIPWEGNMRITIAHKNVPNMLSQFSTIFSSAGVNIENMLNKGKKDYAYTMIDVNSLADESILDKLRTIEGVLNIRVLKK
jgi:D-3-phosphoglycerate dehydrogenase